ncbi:Xk-related protein [Plakobranchus ocellatus]|uniref:XK-related protein n=1 Tax=Plakobranchus ocellatus TaxID=259542 RepID=A0AAV4A7A4_9GAST|nr:Xk-related protein [Plakobranchus ocellatus]
MHALCAGLAWRVFKIALTFSEMDMNHLTLLRLVHVALQSTPYVVIYTQVYIVEFNVNPIQVVSLVVSILSSALVITSFNVGKLTSSISNKKTGIFCFDYHECVSTILMAIGTSFVLAARLVTIALMASQQGLWVCLPLVFHFSIMISIFGYKSFRYFTKSQNISLISLFFQIVYCVSMSWYNVLDWVQDSIHCFMCVNIGFYSLMLVENVVFLSFWLIGSDLDGTIKLITFVGVLCTFIVGLIVKFVGCSSLSEKLNRIESLHPGPCTTLSAAQIHEVGSSSRNETSSYEDNDLVSIIQAVVKARSQDKILQIARTPVAGNKDAWNFQQNGFFDAIYAYEDDLLDVSRNQFAPSRNETRGIPQRLSSDKDLKQVQVLRANQIPMDGVDYNKDFTDFCEENSFVAPYFKADKMNIFPGKNDRHPDDLSHNIYDIKVRTRGISEIVLDPQNIQNYESETGLERTLLNSAATLPTPVHRQQSLQCRSHMYRHSFINVAYQHRQPDQSLSSSSSTLTYETNFTDFTQSLSCTTKTSGDAWKIRRENCEISDSTSMNTSNKIDLYDSTWKSEYEKDDFYSKRTQVSPEHSSLSSIHLPSSLAATSWSQDFEPFITSGQSGGNEARTCNRSPCRSQCYKCPL